MDIKGNYAAALTAEGDVIRITDVDYTIGQNIEIRKVRPVRRKSLRQIGAIAAAAAMILSAGIGTAYALPYGTVSLDADSAIEYTINRFDYVLKVNALNEEGELLLAAMDSSQLCHHPIEQAVAATMELIEQSEVGDNTGDAVRIDADTPSERHTERLKERLGSNVDRMTNAVEHDQTTETDMDELRLQPEPDHTDRDADMQPVRPADGKEENGKTAEMMDSEFDVETAADPSEQNNPSTGSLGKTLLKGDTPPLNISGNAYEAEPPSQETLFQGERHDGMKPFN